MNIYDIISKRYYDNNTNILLYAQEIITKREIESKEWNKYILVYELVSFDFTVNQQFNYHLLIISAALWICILIAIVLLIIITIKRVRKIQKQRIPSEKKKNKRPVEKSKLKHNPKP